MKEAYDDYMYGREYEKFLFPLNIQPESAQQDQEELPTSN
jgi:hypothetical protein